MSVDNRDGRKGYRYTSLAVRLGIGFFILVTAIVLLVGLSLIFISREALQDRVYAQQRATSREIARSISAFVDKSQGDLNLVSKLLSYLAPNEADTELILDSLWDLRSSSFGALTLIDETGQEQVKISRSYTYLDEELVNQQEADYFVQPMNGQTYISPIYLSDGSPTVRLAVPFQASGGEPGGVLVAELTLTSLWSELGQVDIGETGYTYLVDDQGRFVAHQAVDQVLQRYGEDMTPLPPVAEYVTASDLAKAELYKKIYEYEGLDQERVLGNLIPIPGTDWAAVVEIPASEAYAPVQRMQVVLGGLLALGIIMTALAVYLLQRHFLGYIRTLTASAEQFALGNLDVELTIPRRAGEITVLGRAFKRMQMELKSLYASLEEQVAERTRDLEETADRLGARTAELEETTKQLEEVARLSRRRARMLQASSEVSRAIAQIHDIDDLLPRVTQLISEHFGFYHAGIFLVDEIGRYAVLRAANSEGGQRMLARGHRLAVGAKGIVGHVTRTGQPRISLDVGADAVYFDNPDLPETRSEMALPLRLGGETQGVIGALDVQSTESAAFDQEDVAVLSALADQIAIAIQNARLFQQSQQALEETETIYRRRLRAEWDSFLGDAAPRRRQTAVRSLGQRTERE